MNVPMEQQIVTPMPSVLTLMVVMSVLATLVLEETDINAIVSTVSLSKCITDKYYHNADIGECAQGLDNCHKDAECTDTIGSYLCTCNAGFTGNGFNCSSRFSLFS